MFDVTLTKKRTPQKCSPFVNFLRNENEQAGIGRIRSLRGENSGPACISGAGSGLKSVAAKKAPSDLGFARDPRAS
jgi:hypothetical protein